MRWGGVLIFLYVVYHLLDLTFGRVNPSFVPGDVYHNVVASLRVWPVAAAYIAAMVVLGLHLRSEEHTSELQSRLHLVCRLLLEKKKKISNEVNTCSDVIDLLDTAPTSVCV